VDQYFSQITSTTHTASGTVGSLTGAAKALFGPSASYVSLNTGEYGGFGYGWLNYKAGVIRRGGYWADGVNAGVFSTHLNWSTASTDGATGFRCVYHRPAAPASFNDGTTSSLDATPLMTWTADSFEYELAVGTTSGSTNITNWTRVGRTFQAQITGLTLTAGTTYYGSMRAVGSSGEVSVKALGDGFVAQAASSCPTGYVLVPALNGYTTSDFCVAKYEAKKSGAAGISQATSTPWASITQTSAITACQANGTGYDLISNAEWQTIALNIESVPSNWSLGQWGQGSLNRGHSDNAPGAALAASNSPQDACIGTGQTCSNTVWDTQRRTHVLSNGQVIWDVAGNVWEWVKDTNTTNFGANNYFSQITLATNPVTATIGEITGTAKTLYGPWGSYIGLNSGEYAGLGYGWLNYSSGAVFRGGNWSDGVTAGVFSVSLSIASSNTYTSVGFRCVYRP